MHQHYVRPDGLPPVNGYSHVVEFSGRMIAVSGQVPLDGQGKLAGPDPEAQVRQVRDEYISADNPPASTLVQVSSLASPDFRVEIEALAATTAMG